MERLIPPIRELPLAALLLADQQSVDWEGILYP
jgi:hypothetical protein